MHLSGVQCAVYIRATATRDSHGALIATLYILASLAPREREARRPRALLLFQVSPIILSYSRISNHLQRYKRERELCMCIYGCEFRSTRERAAMYPQQQLQSQAHPHLAILLYYCNVSRSCAPGDSVREQKRVSERAAAAVCALEMWLLATLGQ